MLGYCQMGGQHGYTTGALGRSTPLAKAVPLVDQWWINHKSRVNAAVHSLGIEIVCCIDSN